MTERLWYKIGEAAQLIGATPKELRYWERVIPELRPRRSKGNLRYYHMDELPRLQRIRTWLAEGLTVADCRELMLRGHLTRPLLEELAEEAPPEASSEASPGGQPAPVPRKGRKPRGEAMDFRPKLKPVMKALKALVERLSRPPSV